MLDHALNQSEREFVARVLLDAAQELRQLTGKAGELQPADHTPPSAVEKALACDMALQLLLLPELPVQPLSTVVADLRGVAAARGDEQLLERFDQWCERKLDGERRRQKDREAFARAREPLPEIDFPG